MNKTNLLIIIIFLFILLITSIFRNIKNNDINRSNIQSLTSDVVRYKDKYNREVVEKVSFQMKANEFKYLNDSIKEAVKNIKPTVIIKWKSNIEYKDSIIIKYDTILGSKFLIPFSINKQWLNISGISENTGITINKIQIPNDYTLGFGNKRTGLFKPSPVIVSITNSNPHIVATDIECYNIQVKKNIVKDKRTWIGATIGVALGFILFN